jgi:hypothetical protein
MNDWLGTLYPLPNTPQKRISGRQQVIEDLLFSAIRKASDHQQGRDMAMEHHYQKAVSWMPVPQHSLYTYLVRVSNLGPTGLTVGSTSLNDTLMNAIVTTARSSWYIHEVGDEPCDKYNTSAFISDEIPNAIYMPDSPASRTILLDHKFNW